MPIAIILNFLLLFFVARRLLGVPVGWGRVAILSAVVLVSSGQLLQTVAYQLGLTESSSTQALVLVFVVMGGCLLAIQLVILAVLEAIIPTASLPTATSLVMGFPAAMRRGRRYLAIWWIAVRRGLTTYLGPAPHNDETTHRAARSLRRGLTDAGVTFIKFGQMLATRADLLPPAMVRELSKLHSQVDAAPWDKIESVLADELPMPVDEAFGSLDHTPLAAASVAQIHAGTLPDGTAVVVKVQRPAARAQVTADLDILSRLAHRLEKRTGWGKRIGAVALADGFAASLHEELDYTVEVRNMRGVAAGSDLKVPRVFPELCSERVIVMEQIMGEPLSSAATQIAALEPEQRKALAERLLSGVLQQIFVTGVFHADLHPGNVILTTDNDLALLDFGSVGRLDRATRSALILLLHAVDRQDSVAATDALLELLDRPKDLDDRELEQSLGAIMLRAGEGIDTGSLFTGLLDVVVGHGFRVPPQLAAVFRTMGTLDGTLRLLDPDIDLVGVARGHSDELARQLVGPEAIKDQLDHQLATLLPVLSRLPRRLSRITEQLETGTFQLNVSPFARSIDRDYVAAIGGQVSLTVLASVLGLGGLFLLTLESGPLLADTIRVWPVLGATLLVCGLTLGARVVAGVFFRSGQ